jgi:hypothetical protein
MAERGDDFERSDPRAGLEGLVHREASSGTVRRFMAALSYSTSAVAH